MRTFQIILADDEQQILHGMERGIDWEGLGFSVAGTAQNGKEALELMGITELADRSVDELSGGQKQRLTIARALVKLSLIHI